MATNGASTDSTICHNNDFVDSIVRRNIVQMAFERLKTLDNELRLQTEGDLDEKKTEECDRMMQILLAIGKLITNERVQDSDTTNTSLEGCDDEKLVISLLDVPSQLMGTLTLTGSQGYLYHGPLGIMRKLMSHNGVKMKDIPKDAFINLLLVYLRVFFFFFFVVINGRVFGIALPNIKGSYLFQMRVW